MHILVFMEINDLYLRLTQVMRKSKKALHFLGYIFDCKVLIIPCTDQY